MPSLQRFTQLSVPRQVLVRLFQSVNFGRIVGVVIGNGDPVFHPEPTVLLDMNLDIEEGKRPETDLADFVLRDEVRRLMASLDCLTNGRIEGIEIRSGIPRRVVFERRLTEVQS
jgi:hypothetical protein